MTIPQFMALGFASAVAAIAVLLAWFVSDSIRREHYTLGVTATASSLVVFGGLIHSLSTQSPAVVERPIYLPQDVRVIEHEPSVGYSAAVYEAVQSRYLRRLKGEPNGVPAGIHGLRDGESNAPRLAIPIVDDADDKGPTRSVVVRTE